MPDKSEHTFTPDSTDIAILNVLADNARLSYRQIARQVKRATTTVMHRVDALERAGVIKGYSAQFDVERLGYDVTVLIEVKISKGKLQQVEEKVASHPNVSHVFDHTGAFDALIIATFKTRRQMDAFLKKLQTYDFVERTETMLVLNALKEGQIRL
ncbi:Lrp/AsnC family transcriptional regulator [Candidatus Woesearchaeota archaeon]|nr:Lrp/AsnC family transcriptional regulator [Candidatus Woesearchaeota archaeon]